MPDASFDLAEESDFEFLRESIRRYYEYDGIDYDAARVAAGLRALLGSPALGCAWVIRVSGAAVGYAIFGYGFDLEFGGRQATLTDLFLEPAHRRQGLGHALLEHAEAFLASQGVGAVELQVETDNVEALALYEKRGFRRHARLPMSKRLGPLSLD